MKLNNKKTKLMLFDPALTLDFMPSFNLEMEEIELLEETKLLWLVDIKKIKEAWGIQGRVVGHLCKAGDNQQHVMVSKY